VTAHADEATLDRARITEPYGYLLKPFEERELRTAIELALYKHQAEYRLRASERRYATTLASIGDAVIATDAQGFVTFMNPVAEKTTGWSLAEARTRPLAEVFCIIHEQTRAPVENSVERALRDRNVIGQTNPTVLISRDGKEVVIDHSAAPILDDNGAITGAVLVFRDITESRRLEEQLRHAEKMKAVGQLAGGIAHDFNNLLTAILGYAQVLLNSADADHPWAGFLNEIKRAGERAADLTHHLLAFSRKQMLQPKVLDLNEVVVGTEKMLLRLLGQHIEVKTILDPALGPIKADPVQIEQILVNLAVNARDAMPDGGNLTIETLNVHIMSPSTGTPPDIRSGWYRRLRVSDTGCGMSSGVKSRIFEPFFTTKDVGKGTGLGLATVYSIVKRCEGYIHVDSELDRGTTFTLYFPAISESVSQPAALMASHLRRGTETILLVEDEEAVRALARHILTNCGYIVLEAEHGAQALEVAAQYAGRIDLLVTDVVMPRMGGYALVNCLTQDRPGIKVLCMSGYDENLLISPVADGRPFTLLKKPFSMEALTTTVRELLDQ
jgi:hypothetical protein